MVVTVACYVIALGSSALLGVRATVLESVPVCLAPAAFLYAYSRFVFPNATRIPNAIQATVIIIVLGVSLACLSYIGAMADLPLRDREIIWMDRQLGFDWLQVMREFDRWPGVLNLIDWAYATFTSQLIATVLVLVIAKRTRDLDRFFVTFACAAVIAEIASVLVPTLGPVTVLAANADFANLPTPGRATGDIVLALRHGTLKVIDFAALDGIICFPSLHAAVAIIVPFTLRWNKLLFWPILLLDLVMLVSAVPSGNHYLSDVLAGIAIAALAVACGQCIHGMTLSAVGIASIHHDLDAVANFDLGAGVEAVEDTEALGRMVDAGHAVRERIHGVAGLHGDDLDAQGPCRLDFIERQAAE
jgi:membrane-associated phospholipid phosphatase